MSKIKVEAVILILLWISVILSVILNTKFDFQFIGGIIGLSIVSVTFHKFYRFSFLFLLFLISVSIFGLVKFSTSFGLYFSVINIPLLLILVVLVVKKFDLLLDIKSKFFNNQAEQIINTEGRTDFFRQKFKNLSNEELSKKLKDENIVEEAKKAIEELLKINITNLK